MSVIAMEKTMVPAGVDGRVLSRLLEEGYGPGAWHGADLRAALADLPATLAFWRPGDGRHNIAEIALHHAWCVRNVRAQLSGTPAGPFVLDGEDWFELTIDAPLTWEAVQAVVAEEQRGIAELVEALASGRAASPVAEAARFDLVLGLAGHAIYHAGQVQLIKVLHAGQASSAG